MQNEIWRPEDVKIFSVQHPGLPLGFVDSGNTLNDDLQYSGPISPSERTYVRV